MFDRLYVGDVEWQTKAYDCNLDNYFVGDEMPSIHKDYPDSYQVEILGGEHIFTKRSRRSLATVVDGVLVSIDNERVRSLPLIDYGGNLRTPSPGAKGGEGE